MLIPELFRWIFFRKGLVRTTFDATRNKDAIFIDTSLKLKDNQETLSGSIHLHSSNVKEFMQKTPKDAILVLFGNNKDQSVKMHDTLEQNGFTQVFNAGTLKDVKEIKGEK